jgi:phospholipid/cholesterol/gamma-HCH transport system permease protein
MPGNQVRSSSLLEWVGARTLKGGAYLTDLATLVAQTGYELAAVWRRGRREALQVIARQLLFTGVDALPVVTVIALMLGVIVITQAGTQLPLLGADTLIGNVIVVVVIRELGPLLTAFIVIWRSGTAIAVELGNMRVGQEVTALVLMGISVTGFVVMPRVVGTAVAMVCLAFYFDVVAVLGGFLIARLELTIPFAAFARAMVHTLSSVDVVVTAMKSALFGTIIAAIACYHGLAVRASPTEVPQQTTKAMINSVTVCLLVDILVALAAYS